MVLKMPLRRCSYSEGRNIIQLTKTRQAIDCKWCGGKCCQVTSIPEAKQLTLDIMLVIYPDTHLSSHHNTTISSFWGSSYKKMLVRIHTPCQLTLTHTTQLLHEKSFQLSFYMSCCKYYTTLPITGLGLLSCMHTVQF